MEEEVEFPLNILKNLVDKNDQKRQSACKNLQIIVCKNADRRKFQQIQKIIEFFREKYVKTNDNNKKKVGLDVLVAIVNGIKDYSEATEKFTPLIVNIILECLNDTEHKIRFTALKALYYISKALDQKILVMFNQIFEQIMGKITDLDQQVKNAARFLDSALQTILTSALSSAGTNITSHSEPGGSRTDFDLTSFMQILTSKFKSMNPTIRLFLIQWINTLNEMATVDLVIYLPDILQDLLFMLGDKQKPLRNSAKACLHNFEKELQQKFNEGKLEQIMTEDTINNILTILIRVAKGKSSSHTKLIALVWFNLMFKFFRAQIQAECVDRPSNRHLSVNLPRANSMSEGKPPGSMKEISNGNGYLQGHKMSLKKIIIERFDQVLEPILLLMSSEQEEVRKVSLTTNDLLMQNIQMINKEEMINFGKVMPLLKEMLSEKKSTSTSDTVLRWMKFMLENYNDKILPQINDIIEKLVEKLCDSNTKNVISIIESTTVTGEYFELLIQKMLVLLFTNKTTGQDKPETVLKRFSSVLDPQKFCRSLCSQIVSTFDDKFFIFQIVQCLNFLIITQRSMAKVRRRLQLLDKPTSEKDQSNQQFFMTLFHAFKYNPAAVTSLCLLAQRFELAYRIIASFGSEREVSRSVVAGYCKLASLLESPGFLFFRLQLLQKQSHPYLGESLCALLMVLPQGKVFNMLRSRLQICKFMPQKKILQDKKMEKTEDPQVQECIKEFNIIQDFFAKNRMAE